MTDGATTTVSGVFEATKLSSFSLDYRGAAFNALLAGLPVDYALVGISLYRDPSTPHLEVGAYATLLSLGTVASTVYENPSCADAGCDLVMCGICDLGKHVLPGDHAHTFSYGNPFDSGQELVSFRMDFAVPLRPILPGQVEESFFGSLVVQAPVAELDGKPLQPVVGVPEAIQVAGLTTSYDTITKGVGTSPELTWSPPKIGTPTSYRITLVDLTDTPTALHRNIASFDITTTKLKIPTGLLQKGQFYYFKVGARTTDPEDRSAPLKEYPVHDAFSQTFTGVVTP